VLGLGLVLRGTVNIPALGRVEFVTLSLAAFSAAAAAAAAGVVMTMLIVGRLMISSLW